MLEPARPIPSVDHGSLQCGRRYTGCRTGRRSKSSSRRSTASTVREERRSKGSLRTCQGQRATAFAGRGEVVQQQDWVPHRKSAQSGANVFRRHSNRGRDGRLPRIRAHERKLGRCQAIGKQIGRRHMDRVERAERMRRHESFGVLQHFTSDLDQRAELSVGSKPFQDSRDMPRVKRAISYATAQGTAQFNRQHCGCDALMTAQELQHLMSASLVDIALDERAGIEIRPGHGSTRSSRSSMTV